MPNRVSILYAEDDKSVIAFVQVLFKKIENIKITFAPNGLEALELYKKNEHGFDIVISDMLMPVMDGFELIEQIKAIKNDQIILMVTGMEEKKDLIRAIELRVNFFIEKPIKPKMFQTTLEDAINLVYKERQNALSQILLKQYKKTIDANTIVSKTNLKGEITYVNDHFCDITGYTKDELIGKPYNIIKDPASPKSLYRSIWKIIKEQKQVWSGELKNRKKDGSPYWVQSSVSPILDTKGEIIEFIAIETDITQQEQIKEYFESQLKITSKEFDKALNLSTQYESCIDQTNAIIRTDTANIITYVNEKFCQASGFKPNDLLGKNCEILRDISMIERGDCAKFRQQLSCNETVSAVFKNISKQKVPFYMDTLIYPITDIDGKTIEHLHLMYDVTEIITLNQEIENTQKEVVFTMGAIGETRSKETGNHVKRVAEYSYLLAKLYGLEEKEAELIKMASPMHDIGKVAIADGILNKEGRLTKEEFDKMKEHSQIGHDMLKGSTRPIMKTSAIIALEHHERWDGNGYPNGKSGEDIHLYGRLTAICDVFDALGSDRCYKKAWSLEKILKLFEAERGRQFDPHLMGLFLDNLDQFLEIRDTYLD
jgi:PAS domain S-box-containing protein